MADDQDTGYGKPPKKNQWQKGQSGNPNGRPKAKNEFISDLAEILSKPVKAKQPDGSSVSLDSLEVGYLQLCRKALKGDNSALFQVINVMIEVMSEGEKTEDKRVRNGGEARAKLMKMLGLLPESR